MLARQDTVNAVPSRLRLARDNGYFAAYQGIGQCGFTDIGPPDNSDEPAMERFRHFLSCVTAIGRESCADLRALDLPLAPFRSEERRGGKEWVSTGKSRWSAYH